MSHIYTKNGISVPSVTTVLHCLGSSKLMKWANYMGFKHIDINKVLEETSEFGTLAHAMMQLIVDPETNTGETLTTKDALIAYQLNKLADHFRKKFEDINYRTIFTEKTLIDINEGKMYGGTLDWLCEIDGQIVLYDFKTSKKIKPNMLLQLGAYTILLKDEENIEVNKAGIILIAETHCRIVEYSKEELEMAGEAFLNLLRFYELYKDRLDL